MNQHIVAQWFKYKKNLASLYEEQVNALEQNSQGDLLVEFPAIKKYNKLFEFDEHDNVWYFDTIRYLSNKVIVDLLDKVINQGRDRIDLELINVSGIGYEFTCCVDMLYTFKDKFDRLWYITVFFGTGETLVHKDNITKPNLKILLMHIALLMVQRLRLATDNVCGTSIVSNVKQCNCNIHYLIDIHGLKYMKGRVKEILINLLQLLSIENISPLYSLLSDEFRDELLNSITDANEKGDPIDGKRARKKKNGMAIGKAQVYFLLDKLETEQSTGFFAICSFDTPESFQGLGGYPYRLYKDMKDRDNKFTGEQYFIATGRTIEELLIAIKNHSSC